MVYAADGQRKSSVPNNNRMAQTIEHETSAEIHNSSIQVTPAGEKFKTMNVGSPTNSQKNVQYHPLR